MNKAVSAPKHTNTITYSRLTGRELYIVRSLWLLLASFSVIWFVGDTVAQLNAISGGNATSYNELSVQFHFSQLVLPVWDALATTLVGVVFFVVAFILFWRLSDSLISLILSLTLITTGVIFSSDIYARATTLPSVTVIIVYIVIGAGLRLNALFVFPDGHYYPRWAWMFVVVLMVYVVGRQIAFLGNSDALLPLLPIFDVGFFIAGLASQVQRYRHVSNDSQKRQTKWVIFGIVIGILAYYVATLPSTFIPALSDPTPTAELIQLSLDTIRNLGLMAIPICTGIAILRFRLYDIDLIISRSLIYGALTAILAAVFFVLLLVVQALLQQSGIALAASTVTVAVLFQPVRYQLRRVIARRFYHETAQLLTSQLITPTGAYSGLHLGAYDVLELLGVGGMAEVYKGRHTTLNRIVAIKILDRTMAADVEFRKRFEREAQAVAKLRHPNIIRIFDYGEQGNIYYIAMEYIIGQDLTNHLEGIMPLATALPLLQEIAAALDYAHEQGLVHRDVKPSNIMLEPNSQGAYRAILMDFGIAKMSNNQTDLTQTGTVGTLNYMSPEQIMSAHDVTAQADIYSLGVVAYRLLTGVLPFTNDNPGAVILAHLQSPVPDPRRTVPDLPMRVSQALIRALAKNPVDRPQSAENFIQELAS